MIREWLHIASGIPIVMRGLKYALVVGSILIIITHGNAIAGGTVDSTLTHRSALVPRQLSLDQIEG
jgi:hypothetical protein